MNFLQEAQTLSPWLTELRRDFHRRPEHGNKEFHTSAYICRALESMGLEPKRLLETAVTAELQGGRPGPTIALY